MGIYPASFRDFCAKNDVENTKTNTANGAEAAAKQHVSTAIRFYQSIYGIATPRKVEFGKNPPEYEVDDIEIYWICPLNVLSLYQPYSSPKKRPRNDLHISSYPHFRVVFIYGVYLSIF